MAKATGNPIPELTDHPRYAAAKKLRDELGVTLSQWKAKANELLNRSYDGEAPTYKTPMDAAAEAILSGGAAKQSDHGPREKLMADLYDANFQVKAYEAALHKHTSDEYCAAKSEAQRQFVPQVFADKWKPLVRSAYAAYLQYQREIIAMAFAAESLAARDMFVPPICRPWTFTGAIDPVSVAHQANELIKDLVAGGYFAANEPEVARLRVR